MMKAVKMIAVSPTILGIDPGTVTVGTVAIPAKGSLSFWGLKTWKLKGDLNDRLAMWYDTCEMLLTRWAPGIIAVENPVVSRNMRTVDALARFVGVTVTMARHRNLVVLEYRPAQHRLASVGKGIRTARLLPERKEFYTRLKKLFGPVFPSFSLIDEHQLDALSLALAARNEYLQSGQADE